jgi:SAM-dependent methyltransferase
MDASVTNFFAKGLEEGYAATYRLDHSPRIRALLDRYGLKETLKGKRVADIGGGLGFLGELLDPTTEYYVLDGAETTPSQRVSKGHFIKVDLDRDRFGTDQWVCDMSQGGFAGHILPKMDAGFALEVLEHLSNPYHALVELKKLVKEDGLIYLSVPSESVWHNVVYPALLWPPGNFLQFLGQMSLHVVDHWEYKPTVRGWPAYHYTCLNKPWSHKKMAYEKTEAKFLHATPLECTNF